MGVRFGGLGEITLRSVTGVNAPTGAPGSELLAGVVTALAVVRSALSKQNAGWTSASPILARTSSQRVAAPAETGSDSAMAAASMVREDIGNPPDTMRCGAARCAMPSMDARHACRRRGADCTKSPASRDDNFPRAQ